MSAPKWGLAAGAVGLLALYNGSQNDIVRMRTMDINPEQNPKTSRALAKERYGPSLDWLDRVMAASSDKTNPNQSEYSSKLDFRVLSSLMVAGLASGFKSQVANLLWMKSDEYWHQGLLTRQNPLMELVVTLDPQFIDAWSTAGWHWAYNIYADVELNEKYKNKPKLVRQMQDTAIATGLDYLKRGSEMNPEKYRLWFEHGWTRAEKAGYYDEQTVALYRKARSCRDARDIQKDVVDKSGKTRQVTAKGLDILGRTIGHLYERIPELDKALDQYGRDLLNMTPAERAQLDAVGKYWGQYSDQYATIVDTYRSGDATIKAQIKSVVPDVEQMVVAHTARSRMQERNDQPTGAYISLTARYVPTWRLMKSGDLQGAINTIIGVMNSDPKYTLKGLPRLAKVLEIRGDAPAAIQAELQKIRKTEALEAQEIGLHFLAVLYEKMGARQSDPKKKMAYNRLAYDTWYRARVRKTLDFYARTKTIAYEDKYGFKPSQEIIDQIKSSRRGGTPDAAPALPPNVEQYYQKPHEHDEGESI
jgi:hypothetical protein